MAYKKDRALRRLEKKKDWLIEVMKQRGLPINQKWSSIDALNAGYKALGKPQKKPKTGSIASISAHLTIVLRELGAGAKKSNRKVHKKAPLAASSAFLRSPEWKKVRYQALKRSNGCCECCGAKPEDGVRLNVDHIKPRKKYPELALVLINLQVLCGSCNQGKGNWDETDWREPSLKTLMGEGVE